MNYLTINEEMLGLSGSKSRPRREGKPENTSGRYNRYEPSRTSRWLECAKRFLVIARYIWHPNNLRINLSPLSRLRRLVRRLIDRRDDRDNVGTPRS